MRGTKTKEKEHIRKILGLAGNKSQAITIPKFALEKLGWIQGDEVQVTIVRDHLKITLC